MNKVLLAAGIFFFLPYLGVAQCVTASFDLPADPYSVCLGQEVKLENTSTNAISYTWDFCVEQLTETPTVTTTTIPGLTQGRAIKMVFDGTNWFGFVTGRTSNTLHRLEFGADPESVPVITNLGTLSGALVNPEGLDIMLDDDGNWYGFTGSQSGSNLLRLEFGTSLLNTPTTTNFASAITQAGERFRSFDLARQGANHIVVTVSSASNRLYRIDFGSSLGNTITSADVVSDVIAGASGLSGLSVTRVCSDWYIHAVSNTNSVVQQIYLGSDLLGSPVVQSTSTYTGVTTPYRVKTYQSGSVYYALVTSSVATAPLTVINFGDLSLSETPSVVTNAGLQPLLGVDVFWHNGKAIVAGSTATAFRRMKFDKDCSQGLEFSVDASPEGLHYDVAGDYEIQLRANDGVQTSITSKNIEVRDKALPALTIVNAGVCVNTGVDFTITSDKTLVSAEWDFGDGDVSNDVAPTHAYGLAALYTPSVIVTDADGCVASAEATLEIYQPPVADFTLPPGLICTNSTLTFVNDTPDDFDGHLTFGWYVNTDLVATTRDLEHSFNATGAQSVQLVVTIPGCSDDKTENIPQVDEGPVLDFTAEGQCAGEAVTFIPVVLETVTDHSWDFGDGNVAMLEQADHTFALEGTYLVTLSAVNGTGCTGSVEKDVTIYPVPVALFSSSRESGVVPLSVDFTNTSTNALESAWDFGDGGTSAETSPEYEFTVAGDHEVTLEVSNNGCTDNFSQTIHAIAPLPCIEPGFDFPADPYKVCIDQPLELTNTSANAAEYAWDFCAENFLESPATTSIAVTGLSQGRGFRMIQDGANWYGFVASRNNNKLFRLDFGSDPESNPSVADLGDLGGTLSTPEGIDVMKDDNGNWYGFTGSSSINGELLRLEFGTSLTNVPAVTSLVTGESDRFRDMVIVKQVDGYVLVMTGFTTNKLIRVNFGSSLENDITAEDVVSDVIAGASGLIGLAVTETCNEFYVHTVSFTNNVVQQLYFGNDLLSTPQVQSTSTYTGVSSAFRIKAYQSANRFYVVVSNQSLPIAVIDFSDLGLVTPPAAIANPGFPSTLGLDIFWHKGKAFVVGTASSTFVRSKFEKVCDQNLSFSLDEVPVGLKFQTAGSYEIQLRASNGNRSRMITKSFEVMDKALPQLSITTEQKCAGFPVNFSALSDKALTSMFWQFGDGGTSTATEPVRSYVAAGTYGLSLSVVDQDGCVHTTDIDVKMYDPPSTDFVLPSGIVCTNNPVEVVNTTPDNFDGHLSYAWHVDGEAAGDTRDLTHTFVTGGAKDVRLVTSIPGCSDEITKNLTNVDEGPLMDFSIGGQCVGDAIQFMPSASESVTGHQWNFGDGNSSTDEHPVHTFEAESAFGVTLSATSANGCQGFIEKTIDVFLKPTASFTSSRTSGAAPLQVQFTNTSIGASAVAWDFKDGDVSTDDSPLHVFSALGEYEVQLTATDQGCSSTFAAPITVLPPEGPCVQASFDFPTDPYSVCLQQEVDLANTSQYAQEFQWDFCPEDFSEIPVNANTTVTGLSQGRGFKMVFDGTNYFGFATSRNNNSLLRLDFGSNPVSSPIVTDLSALTASLATPEGIDIIQDEEGDWYGFTGSSSTGKLLRLEFGNSLSNTPAITNFESVVPGERFRDMVMVNDGGNYILVATSFLSNRLYRINFGTSPANAIEPNGVVSDVIPDASGLAGLAVTQVCDDWYVHTVSFTNNVMQQIFFGTDLLDSPVVQSTSMFPEIASPFRIKVYEAASGFYALVSNQALPVAAIRLGNLIDTPQAVVNPAMPSLLGLDVMWHQGKVLVTGLGSSAFIQSAFEKICGTNVSFSLNAFPEGLVFQTPGSYAIQLRAIANGRKSVARKTVEVKDFGLPVVTIVSAEVCAGSPVNFATSSDKPITSAAWDFGDGGNSSLLTPQHTFDAAQTYPVSVVVTDADGCVQQAQSDFTLYPQPQASFTVPTGLICTNNPIDFVNNTTDNYDGHLTFEWLVNDESIADSRDLQHTFTNGGTTTVRLTASIPGCANEHEANIGEVSIGPVIDFSVTGKCEQEDILFQSIAQEAVTDHTWDFADGSGATGIDAQHNFGEQGVYLVKLTAVNSTGCPGSKVKSVPVFSKPDVDFSIAPPPLSCSGSNTPFTNLTPTPPDSEIATWQWDFGDNELSTDQEPAHIYTTAGSYDVSLMAETDQGCSNSILKTVSILPSPSSGFSNTPACVGVPTEFSPNATDAQAHYWEMGTVYYTSPTPSHTFQAPGSQNVVLTVIGANGCVAMSAQLVVIPEKVGPAFTVTQHCVGEEAIFSDITTGDDAVADVQWTFGDSGSASGSPAAFTFSNNGDETIRLSVTTVSGCVYTARKTISILDAPVASFAPSFAAGAAPLAVSFANTSTGAQSSSWNFGDGSTSAENAPQHTFASVGDFEVLLTVANEAGCTDTFSEIISTSAPVPDVSITAMNTVENPDGSQKVIITLLNKGNTIVTNLPVEINLSGNAILTEMLEGPILPGALHNAVISFQISQQTGIGFLCAETKLDNDTDPAGNRFCIEFEQSTISFHPYPNPASDFIVVEWIAAEPSVITLSLSDAFGKTHAFEKPASAKGLNQVRFDVRHLSSGIYFVTARDQAAVKTYRIVISREN